MKRSKYISSLLYQIKADTKVHQKMYNILLIVEYFSNVDNVSAEKYVRMALELVTRVNPELQIKTYLTACSVYSFLGNKEKVTEFTLLANECLQRCEKPELQKSLIDFFFLVFQGRSGNPEILLDGLRNVFALIDEQGSTKERATLYHSYGLALSFLGKNDEALEYLLKAVHLAESVGLCVMQVRSMLSVLEVYSRLGLNEEVLSYSTNILSKIVENDLIHFEGRCRLYRGRNLYYLGKVSESVEELLQARFLFGLLNDKQGEYYALINLCSSYRELGLLEDAVQQIIPLLQLKEHIWWEVRYHAYMQLGLTFLHSGDPEKAIELLHLALAQLSHVQSNLDFFTAPLIGNLGYAYLLLKQYNKAEEYLSTVLNIFIQSDFQRQVSTTLINISALFIVRDDYEKAEETINQALLICRKISYVQGIIDALNILAEVYHKTRRYEEAIAVLHELIEHTEGHSFLRSEMNAHRLLAEIYEIVSDELKAFRHLKKYNELHEKFWNFEVASNIYDVFRVIEEQKYQKKEFSLSKAKEHLEVEIRQRERELRSMAIQLTQRNQALLTLKNEVDKIRSENIRKKRKSLPKELLNSVRDLESGWESFRVHFDTVHNGYYDRLIAKYPQLTEAEAKICCLMKVDLSTKQIADVLFISPRTVETHRLKIRKKIIEERNADLRKHLISLE